VPEAGEQEHSRADPRREEPVAVAGQEPSQTEAPGTKHGNQTVGTSRANETAGTSLGGPRPCIEPTGKRKRMPVRAVSTGSGSRILRRMGGTVGWPSFARNWWKRLIIRSRFGG